MAIASQKAEFSALKVGYDNNADNDIDDGGDDLVVSNPFGTTSITPTHDDNGNLTFDGTYKYTYDAWNRLVKATLEDTDVVIQQAQFDGLGRRVKKTVTNSGDLDGVTVYLYNGHQIIETRDGSGNVETQVYHGTRYIDEVVGLRVKDQGRAYLHQDANWNVTAMTDLTGRIIERYWYSPYGELEAVVAAHPFDYDDDGDVDDDDYAVTTNGTCSGAAAATGDCRRLDANADGVVNGDDRTVIAAYIATLDSDTELQRIPAATHSRRGNFFAHQGLVLDPELASYQNRARQYAPGSKRFIQNDPLVRLTHARSNYPDGMSLYSYLTNRPQARLDPRGMRVSNGSNQSVWVLIDGVWVELPPYSSIGNGDTDASGPYDPRSDGKVLKTNDCFDINVHEDGSMGTSYNPHGGSTTERRCCCRIAHCAAVDQWLNGGWVDPQGEFGSKPPNYP